MVDTQLVRLSDARDLLRLMVQLIRVSAAPALWRSTLIEGLSNVLHLHVVGIFCIPAPEAPESATQHSRATPECVEVTWAGPAGSGASHPLPLPLERYCAMRKKMLAAGIRSAQAAGAASSANASAGERPGRDKSLIELTFYDALPPPLAIKYTSYLLYSGTAHVNPGAGLLVTLLHSELHRHFAQQHSDVKRAILPELLPERQRQILERLLAGDGEKQIARHLGLSIHTVHSYIRRLYIRLNVSSRSELFRACYGGPLQLETLITKSPGVGSRSQKC